MNARQRFDQDVAVWHAETSTLSDPVKMCMHPAYQRIIGLGPEAVPLIIERLRQQPDHFYWALTAIVGEDKAAGAQTLPEAAQRWVDWYDLLNDPMDCILCGNVMNCSGMCGES